MNNQGEVEDWAMNNRTLWTVIGVAIELVILLTLIWMWGA